MSALEGERFSGKESSLFSYSKCEIPVIAAVGFYTYLKPGHLASLQSPFTGNYFSLFSESSKTLEEKVTAEVLVV